MANEESGQRKCRTRRSIRPVYAEDVYGAQSLDNQKSNSGVTTVISNIITNSFNSLATDSGSTGNYGTKLNNKSALNFFNDMFSTKNTPNQYTAEKFEQNWESQKAEKDGALTALRNRQSFEELNFNYADCDQHKVELAELYTYSEVDDFALNCEAFCQYVNNRKLDTKIWCLISNENKSNIIHDLLQRLENANSEVRLNAARILLYILQGSFYDFSNEDQTYVNGDVRETNDKNFFDKESPPLKVNSAQTEGKDENDKGTGGFDEDCLINSALNSYFIYEMGLFQPLCTMLAVEKEESSRKHLAKQQSVSSLNSSAAGASMGTGGNLRRSATLADNESLRVVINCLYHMVEAIRRVELIPEIVNFCSRQINGYSNTGIKISKISLTIYSKERLKVLHENFITELDEPLESSNTALVILLFDMMPDFVQGKSPHYPIKKMLLLTWKVLLATLGDFKVLREEKARRREAAGLSKVEDTFEVAMRLKSVVYGSEADAFLAKLSRVGPSSKFSKIKSVWSEKPRFLNRQSACVSGSLNDNSKNNDEDDNDCNDANKGRTLDEDNESIIDDAFQTEDEAMEIVNDSISSEIALKTIKNSQKEALQLSKATPEDNNLINQTKPSLDKVNLENPLYKNENDCKNSPSGDQTPRAGSPVNLSTKHFDRFLPWKTKVGIKDLECFLQKERQKYFEFQLENDFTSLFGFPGPVLQSVEAFKRNIYVSLGEKQIEMDNDYNRLKFSKLEFIEETKAERLYRRMLPNMTEYVITLLKVILVSLPSSKTKSDAVTILSDVLTPENDTHEMLSNSISLDVSGQNVLEEAVRFAIDINRHKELIVKASSAIIIMLLKFFRLNHIYQFENFAQYLVLANCLPLVLKFIDQNMLRYMQSKHELLPLNYPQCPLYYVRNAGNFPTLDVDNVYEVDTDAPNYFLWRNVFSSINLLRVLNKLTKWKHARTMMLVVFKSAPVLKRCMRIRLGVFQLYILKLLKMQARFLGRQWRKSNMDIISSIYMKVRHRLNDDWAFANETRSKSWDFQAEEGELSVAVKNFNRRRYKQIMSDSASTTDNKLDNACLNCHSNENALRNDEHLITQNHEQRLVVGNCGFHTTENCNSKREIDENNCLNGSRTIDGISEQEFEPVENCLQAVLSWKPKFTNRFVRNYGKWVEEEVIRHKIDWDAFLVNTRGIAFEPQF